MLVFMLISTSIKSELYSPASYARVLVTGFVESEICDSLVMYNYPEKLPYVF